MSPDAPFSFVMNYWQPESPMILHLYAGNLYGGIETHLLNLMKADQLPEFSGNLRHGVALCFESRLSAELQAIGAEFFQLGEVRFRYPWTVWRARHRLSQIIREKNVECLVAHASWSYRLGYPTAHKLNVPIIFMNHDILKCNNRLERFAAVHQPDKIITNSYFTAQSCLDLFGRKADAVIYPATSIYQPDFIENANLVVRKELNTSASDVVIIQFSRFESWKGHESLIRALGLLKSLPGWRLWMAGGVQKQNEIAYADSLKALAKSLGIHERIAFLGQRKDMPRVLAAADIHCQPNSGPEPFGLAFVEALAAGLPSVSTNHGGATEIITPACGILVPPDSPEALAEGLRSLILSAELRKSLGKNGPARAAELCDPAGILRQLNLAIQT